jgi:hypothetical protein
MTKKKIAKAYIEAAEKCISEGRKDNLKKFMNRLHENYLAQGVCWFVEIGLNVHKTMKYVQNRKYFERGRLLWWTDRPVNCSTKKEAIQALQYRINILKTWL